MIFIYWPSWFDRLATNGFDKLTTNGFDTLATNGFGRGRIFAVWGLFVNEYRLTSMS